MARVLKVMPRLSMTSKQRLDTCHPLIQKVIYEAIKESPVDFLVVCGYRNQEDQDKAFAQGYSKVKFPNGKHNHNPSLAVDLAPVVDGKVLWDDSKLFERIADHVLAKAVDLDVNLTWGGNWTGGFVDQPHFQLELEA